METLYDLLLLGTDGFTILLAVAGFFGSFLVQRTTIGTRLAPFLSWFRLGLVLLAVSFGFSIWSTVSTERHHFFEFIHHVFLVFSVAALSFSTYSLYRLVR